MVNRPMNQVASFTLRGDFTFPAIISANALTTPAFMKNAIIMPMNTWISRIQMKSSLPRASFARAEKPKAGSCPSSRTPERQPMNRAKTASFFQNASSRVSARGINDKIP